MNTEEGKTALVALMVMLTDNFLNKNPVLDIQSTGLDKYGRPIVRIGNINDKMVEGGYATKY
jgi:hypothetical protein